MKRLTTRHKLAIQRALIRQYREAMECLNFESTYTRLWLEIAGNAWDAYIAVSGHPIGGPKSGARNFSPCTNSAELV
jgi:hypothetical protein